MENFNEYAYYYNAFYGDKDYSKEAGILNELIMKHWNGSKKPKTILNLGCGTGSHDKELSKLGYYVKGIDISPNMIKLAKKNVDSDRNTFETGDVRTYRDGQKYDICSSLFHVMSYQNSNDDILNSFRTAYNELVDNGLFIFDCWYGPGVLTEKPTVRVKKAEDDKNIYLRTAEPVMHVESNVVDVNYNVYVTDKKSTITTDFSEMHCMRFFFNPEIENMLDMCGFEMIECLDCNTLRKPNYDSWTVYFVARKK